MNNPVIKQISKDKESPLIDPTISIFERKRFSLDDREQKKPKKELGVRERTKSYGKWYLPPKIFNHNFVTHMKEP